MKGELTENKKRERIETRAKRKQKKTERTERE